MTAYEIALEAHNAAFAVYDPIRLAYRVGKIGDAEYLAARAIYAEATEAFDAAYAVACDAPEESEGGLALADDQLALEI